MDFNLEGEEDEEIREIEVQHDDEGGAFVQISYGDLGIGFTLTDDERRSLANQLWLEGDDEKTEIEVEEMLTSGTLTDRYVLSSS